MPRIPEAGNHQLRPYVVINRGSTGHDELTLRFEGDVTELFPWLVRAALAEA
jgi:hypothetical protein